MIIVEGPDGAGKTTLANKLADHFRLEVKDWGVPRNDMPNVGVKRRVYESLSTEIRGSNKDPLFIHDRLYFSELVYGYILRGKEAFSHKEQIMIEKALAAMVVPVIFCLPPEHVVVANVARTAQEQMEGVEEYIEPIYRRYRLMASRMRKLPQSWGRPICTHDYTGEFPSTTYEGIKLRVEEYLEFRESRKWQE